MIYLASKSSGYKPIERPTTTTYGTCNLEVRQRPETGKSLIQRLSAVVGEILNPAEHLPLIHKE